MGTSRSSIQFLELLVGVALGISIGGWLFWSAVICTRPPPTPQTAQPRRFIQDNVQRMITARSSQRAFQQKRGMVNPRYWLNTYAEDRSSQFWSWIDLPGVSQPPTPYPHCQIYINHDYKFIWVKGHKVGSTAMRGSLGWLCEDNWWVPEDADFSHCASRMFDNSNVTLADAQRHWHEYFVFGVVRNPFARFASAYEYISERMPGGCPVPDVHRTCRDPFLLAKTCRLTGCCGQSTIIHHVRHFIDQSTCLYTDQGEPAVDFIAEQENLNDDLQTIVDVINHRRDEGLPPLEVKNGFANMNPKTGGQPAERSRQFAELFESDDACLVELLRTYRKDFLLLGYLPNIF